LSARLTKEKIPHGLVTGAQNEDERQQAIDDFQSGKNQFILFTAAAGGVGITLTAAKCLVRLQRPWSLIDDRQALKRVHRIGSEIHDKVVIIDYVVEGTVEERVINVLDEKGESFEDFVKDKDLLRRALEDDDA
jgi:SNF2 family DNA or RNA helicase